MTASNENVGAADSRDAAGTATKVSEIVRGAMDGRGERIDYVYFKRDDYAIYCSGWHVLVANSDNKEEADKQIRALSGLFPLRDHLINLIQDLPPRTTKNNYRDQIAEAFRLGLEQQPDAARAVIDEAMRSAVDVQARIGRMVYLKWAAGLALAVAALVIPFGGYFVQHRSGVHLLLMATGAGAVGALLSIAIAIRSRSVAIDGNWQANAADAAIRVLMGVISGAILFLFLNSGLLTDLQVGGIKFTGTNIQWQAALLVGFVAGFLERLLPDLLERAAPTTEPPTATLPRTNTGVASPTVTRSAPS